MSGKRCATSPEAFPITARSLHSPQGAVLQCALAQPEDQFRRQDGHRAEEPTKSKLLHVLLVELAGLTNPISLLLLAYLTSRSY